MFLRSMAKITALRMESRRKRTRVFLDSKFAFSLGAGTVATAGLRTGQELSEADIERLTGADRLRRCRDTALRYLDYRPRSEAELRVRLQQRGVDDDAINSVVARLKEQGLVNDEAFARFWKENREAFRPRSRRLTRLELRRKGVENSVIEQVVNTIDDGENAYQSALKKARLLPPDDRRTFQRRLGDYLRRRGFDYEVINQTVARIWKERGVAQ